MTIQNRRALFFQIILSGFGAGLFIIFFTIASSLIAQNLSLSWSSISTLHQNFPVFWFLDVLPIAFAIGGFYLARFVYHNQEEKEQARASYEERSKHLKDYIEGLTHENQEADFSELENSGDELAQSVKSLKDKLEHNKQEEEERKKEEERRRWASEGLAKFGEILRQQNEDLEKLSFNILSNLVKYIDATQGGFFLINNEDENNPFIEQMAAYAYDRKKFTDTQLQMHEGLIGAAIYEQEKIYMTEIPESYLSITSGLGETTPDCLLIVPLKINEEVVGAIELAGFGEFESYKIDFVEKLSESIASTISNIRINLRTSKLLEDSLAKEEQLKHQEEEMRQNLEELQSTQEELERQSEIYKGFTQAVNQTLIRAEYDTSGELIYANDNFLDKMGFNNKQDLKGKTIFNFVSDKDQRWFKDIWDKLIKGEEHFEGYMKHLTKTGHDLWTIATYSAFKNKAGEVEKVLFLAIDNTEQKKQSLDYQGQIEALKQSTIKAEFLPNGSFLDANRRLRNLIDTPIHEIYERSIFDILAPDEKKDFENKWNKIINGESQEGIFQISTGKNNTKWLRGTFTGVNDMYGEISKVIFIANDITQEKLMEIQTQKQTEQLKIQEEKLRESEANLSKKLKEAREEVKQQFQEIEKIKIRNEKTLEGALDAILTISEDGTVQFFNKAAENLWNIERENILGKDVKNLFPDETRSDEFIAGFIDPQAEKMVGQRKEVTILDMDKNEKNVIFLLSEAQVDDEYTYTAFIQDISVDLF